MQKTKIKYTVEFELQDFDKFNETFPNFKYNYRTFEEWVQSNMNYLFESIDDIEGYTLKIKREKN